MKQINNNSKLTIVTREDLSPGYQLTQSAHVMAEFSQDHPDIFKSWKHESNYLACLSVRDEISLELLASKLVSKQIKFSVFREPDINNQITAIAIEPSDDSRRVCSSIPLALKNFKNGINKHNHEIDRN